MTAPVYVLGRGPILSIPASARVLFLGRSRGGWYHDHAAVSTIYRPAPVPIDVPSAPAVRLIPLGGLGEIGLNMMLVESGDDVIAVDCGLLFPDDEMPGVDYVCLLYTSDAADERSSVDL